MSLISESSNDFVPGAGKDAGVPSAISESTGTVYKKTIGTYFVQSAGQTVVCAISNKLRKELVYPIADPTSFRRRVMAVEEIDTVDPVAIGDCVRFTPAGDASGAHTGLITAVLPRRNKLARPSAGFKPLEQVIVANVDQVVPVFAAAHPAPKWNLLDRYLVSAEASGVPALICITKLDLAADGGADGAGDLDEVVQDYRRLGYPVILTSATTGEGIAEITAALQGRVSVFVGKSGVGKSSLLNAIEPGLGIRVNTVSQSTDKGKHTTTHLELFPLVCGGGVVDTPGMREFGLWQVDGADVANYFPEMRPHLGYCKYGANCRHLREPGCAIKRAVQAGQIAERRYESYAKLAGG
jgi:ribosome biogenesis GTPase / thiamine phosphate phosphatase